MNYRRWYLGEKKQETSICSLKTERFSERINSEPSRIRITLAVD